MLKLAGEISVFGAADLRSSATEAAAEAGNVVVDCGELQSVDLAALQILLAMQRAVVSRNRNFRLVGLSPEMADVFAMVKLEQVSADVSRTAATANA